ncbi:hypothetical protein [Micromonospora endolithica]|nr:hypothetical protein [Micromonospora endolithica]
MVARDVPVAGDVERVARALEELRKAGIWQITSYRGHEPLCELLGIDPEGPFVRALFVDRLKAKVDTMGDDAGKQRIGLLLGVAPGMRGRSPRDLIDVVKETFNQRTGTESASKAFSRDNLRARKALARELLSSPRPSPSTESRHVGIAYVRRPDLETLVDRELSADSKTISLIGDSGNGKSRLAYEVLQRHCAASGSVLVHLHAGEGESLNESASRHCIEWFPDVANPSLAVLHDAFRKRGIGCAYLLDDVADWEVVRRVARMAGVVVVLTSDREIVPSEVPHTTIVVGPMETDAARALVGRFITNIEHPDVDRFLGAAGNKPRAIIDCLSIFAEAGFSLGELCDQLERQPRTVLRSLSRSERSLVHAYDRLLSQLDSDDPNAALLLRIVANVGASFIYTAVLGDIFDLALERGSQSPPRGEFERCLYVLHARLHFDWDRARRPARDQFAMLEYSFLGSVHFNELTYGILAELTADFSEECSALADAAYERAEKGIMVDFGFGEVPVSTASHFFWRAHVSGGVLLSDGCVY